eukprot:Polyplicarium_translucidae@DN2985_c0_g1_i4.p2
MLASQDRIGDSLQAFQDCSDALEASFPDDAATRTLKAVLLSNQAQLLLRRNQHAAAHLRAEAAISCDPSHTKSYFRSARALLSMGRFEKAKERATDASRVHTRDGEKAAIDDLLAEISESAAAHVPTMSQADRICRETLTAPLPPPQTVFQFVSNFQSIL